MSQYVVMQRKSEGMGSESKKRRLDVLEAKPEEISPGLGKTESVEKTKSSETVNSKSEPFAETNEDNKLPALIKVMAKAGVTESVLSGNPELAVSVSDPELEYKINMETEETAAEQAQRKMHEFTSTVTELCTGFTTSKKQIEELTKQVTDLESQIQDWKDQKVSWDQKIKVLETDREEARDEARRTISEKCDLKKKLVKAAKETDDAKASNKKFASIIRELVTDLATSWEQKSALEKHASDLKNQIVQLKNEKAIWAEKKKILERRCDDSWMEANIAVSNVRDLEDKLEKASKEAEDAKTSSKKARLMAAKQTEDAKKAVALTRESYKTALGNFVAYLANDEGKLLEDYVNELVKEKSPPADGAVDSAGHEGDKAIKNEAL